MNIIKAAFLAGCLSISSLVMAAGSYSSDYDFQQERMILSNNSVLMISTFEDQDHICAYSFQGDILWDTTFHAKIVSWKVVSDYVFVFSKHRQGYKTYITCLNRHTGNLIWQRP